MERRERRSGAGREPERFGVRRSVPQVSNPWYPEAGFLMRQAFAVFIAVVSGTCCSARGPIETDPTKAPDTSKVMALVGRFSVAHGCPISETRVLTSAHVIDQEPGNRNVLYQTFRWSDENGLGGYVVPGGVMAGSDLAVMTSVPPVPSWYTRASVPPA